MSTIWAELAQWICSPPYDTRSCESGGRTLLPHRARPAGLQKAEYSTMCAKGAILKA